MIFNFKAEYGVLCAIGDVYLCGKVTYADIILLACVAELLNYIPYPSEAIPLESILIMCL